MSIRIGLCGASGKMGQALVQRISESNKNCSITAKFTSASTINDLKEFCKNSDVIIDFSSPDILKPLLDNSVLYNTKLVIGTTNIKQIHVDFLNEASNYIPIIYSANMSICANLMTIFSAKIAKILASNDYDIEILDKHHSLKKDSPSGTSLMIGRAIASARNVMFEESAIFNRHDKGGRLKNEIGFSSIRGGGIYGEHDVFFIGDNETLTIKHQAFNKISFADGAIEATCWIIDKQSGLYSMIDVLDYAQI